MKMKSINELETLTQQTLDKPELTILKKKWDKPNLSILKTANNTSVNSSNGADGGGPSFNAS